MAGAVMDSRSPTRRSGTGSRPERYEIHAVDGGTPFAGAIQARSPETQGDARR